MSPRRIDWCHSSAGVRQRLGFMFWARSRPITVRRMDGSEHRKALDEIAKENATKPDRGARKRLDEVAEILDPDEVVLAVLGGQAKNESGKDTIGVAVLSDKRIVYVGSLMMQRASESFRLDRIDSVQASKGMLLAGLTITVPGSSFRLDKSNKRDAERFAAKAKDAIAHAYTSNSGPAASSLADEIRKLGELRDEGLLTPDESDAQKAKLLG